MSPARHAMLYVVQTNSTTVTWFPKVEPCPCTAACWFDGKNNNNGNIKTFKHITDKSGADGL